MTYPECSVSRGRFSTGLVASLPVPCPGTCPTGMLLNVLKEARSIRDVLNLSPVKLRELGLYYHTKNHRVFSGKRVFQNRFILLNFSTRSQFL
jgi:hypothetical protein